MAIPHAAPGQIIDVRSSASSDADEITQTLIKTPHLEVIQLMLPAGEEIAEHKVDGAITVQCLAGCVEFTARGQTQELHAGQMLYLQGADPHALKSVDNSSVLVTILL